MPTAANWLAFAAVALGLALLPGPNMIYLASRAICQGRKAALISLAGVGLGFVFFMASAALGLTALFVAVPYAYDAVRLAGAAYLLYLAWAAVRPGGRAPFETRALAPDSPRKLFVAGLLTNLLNPKVAMFYLSLLPQFIDPDQGHVLAQSLILGVTQVCIGTSVNFTVLMTAGTLAGLLSSRPSWLAIQRWVMGTVLAGLAVRIATEGSR
jgi:threonine/homoserine/homoserine lactone efflux protein